MSSDVTPPPTRRYAVVAEHDGTALRSLLRQEVLQEYASTGG